jgi:ABC-2 type transport system permease protein
VTRHLRPMPHAVRLGFGRARIEFGHMLTNRQDLGWLIVINGILLTVLIFQRNSTVEGVSLAAVTLPSLLGMSVVTGGVFGTANALAADREDGTLLRAKATPHGMVGYLVAKLTFSSMNTMFGILVILVPGLFLVDELTSVGAAGWLTLVGVLVLGKLATLPWGAILGSLANSTASSFGFTFVPIAGLVSISGIFYPITAMPGWIQAIAQVFPVYWLGLGMRSALLPDAAAAVELGGSWRTWQTVAVLAAWAVVGLLAAPAVLRRMARRESGSAVESRRQRLLQRVG